MSSSPTASAVPPAGRPGRRVRRPWPRRAPAPTWWARHRGLAGEAGIGLVEVITAFAILLIVLVPVSYLLTNSLQSSGQDRTKVAALSVAEKWLETLNNSGPTYADTIPIVGTTISEPKSTTRPAVTTPTTGDLTTHYTTDDGTRFYASASFSWATPNVTKRTPTTGKYTPDICTSGSVPDVLRLTVTVKWGSGGANSISDTTLTNYPPAGLPKDGFIGVQILRSPTDPTDLALPESETSTPWGGGNDTRVREIPVSIKPITSTVPATLATTINPATNGCAFIERPPGTYEVSVGPKTLTTPFVTTGTTTYSEAYAYPDGAVTVVQDAVSEAPFVYDEGAYVGVKYPDTSVADQLATCSTAAQLCLATGQSPSGMSPDGSTGTIATVSVLSGSSWSQVQRLTSQGIAQIESATCNTALCVAVGDGSTGAAAVTHVPSGAATAWSTSSVPTSSNASSLSEVRCPSSTACIAIGSGTSGAVVLDGAVTGSTVSWTSATLSGAVTSISQVTCPATTTCLALGNSGSTAVVLSGTSTAPGSWTWASDTLPTGTSALTQITCPSATTCLAIGTVSGKAAVLLGTLSGSSPSWTNETLPSGVSSLAAIACPATTACLAVGTGSGGAAIVAGGASGSWVSDTATAATSLTRITCPGTGVCFAGGWGSTGAEILGGKATGTSQKWSAQALPSSISSPTFVAGVGCFKSTKSGTPLVCGAVGAVSTGAVLLGDPTAQSGTSSWSAATVGSAAGVVSGGLSVAATSSSYSNTSFVACTSSSSSLDSCSTIGPLFPIVTGYSLGAGTCKAEWTAESVSTKTVPGTKTTRAPSVTLPLGFLDVDVITSSSAPVNDAPVTLTVTDPTHGSCGGSFALGSTGRDGQAGGAVMYETYKVTAGNITEVLKVSRYSATVLTSTTRSVTQSYRLPSPVVFVT